MPGRGAAVAALVLFAGATALSMSAISALWGWTLHSRAIERRLARVAPAIGLVSLAFGATYGVLAVV